MFNSAIIDVAIGMILSFLAVSLAASAITEAISSILKWRENDLEKGFKALLNFDPAKHPLALELYNHALISPLNCQDLRDDGTQASLHQLRAVRSGLL
jgi:hypothetical protein